MVARILIIEDDDGSRELAKYLLAAAGYTTLEADNGGVGLAIALNERPDLIICDLQMPVMNGIEVVRALRSHPGWYPVPLLAVTAFSMTGDRETALAAGFDEHVTKPITPETFAEQVESLLPQALRATAPPRR